MNVPYDQNEFIAFKKPTAERRTVLRNRLQPMHPVVAFCVNSVTEFCHRTCKMMWGLRSSGVGLGYQGHERVGR